MNTRRHFLQASASLALVSLLPRTALTATTLYTRPSWQSFSTGSLYPVFLDTVKRMKANTDSTKPSSWLYWVNAHGNHCPHGKPYFLAWHRGFLRRFEAQLRTVSAHSNLVLPYWNYYDDSRLPPEFTDPSSPLYRSNRVNTDVYAALSLAPFDDSITHFQRGLTDAFEPAVESAPHNPVHNLIGGAMANIAKSPLDPIFWVHHANIDRLWDAWVLAGGGRQMPSLTSSYWSGSFSYGTAVKSMARSMTYSTSGLGYVYANRNMPTSLPSGYAQARASTLANTQPVAAQGLSLGGAAQLVLGAGSTRVRIALGATERNRLLSVLTQPASAAQTLRVVLDGVRMTAAGAQGGYFFKVMLNVPANGATQPESTYQIGTLGAFEISTAQHAQMMAGGHGMHAPVQMVLPATDALRRIWPQPLDALTVDFVRVDGQSAPQGPVIAMDQVRVEAATP